MLVLEDATLRLDGTTILDGINLHVRPQEALGLIGPNGSGKSSLLNAVTGIYPLTRGRVLIAGVDATSCQPHEVVSLGVARTAQSTRLFEHLSVLDNVRAVVGGSRKQAEQWLEEVGLIEQRFVLAGTLSFSQRRRLDLARALMLKPSLLLLDEPAAALTESETAEMAELLMRVARPGRALIVIEHKIELVAMLCPNVVVLNAGRKIAEGKPEQLMADAHVQSVYFGTEDSSHA